MRVSRRIFFNLVYYLFSVLSKERFHGTSPYMRQNNVRRVRSQNLLNHRQSLKWVVVAKFIEVLKRPEIFLILWRALFRRMHYDPRCCDIFNHHCSVP